jgi:hypothetical protein
MIQLYSVWAKSAADLQEKSWWMELLIVLALVRLFWAIAMAANGVQKVSNAIIPIIYAQEKSVVFQTKLQAFLILNANVKLAARLLPKTLANGMIR